MIRLTKGIDLGIRIRISLTWMHQFPETLVHFGTDKISVVDKKLILLFKSGSENRFVQKKLH